MILMKKKGKQKKGYFKGNLLGLISSCGSTTNIPSFPCCMASRRGFSGSERLLGNSISTKALTLPRLRICKPTRISHNRPIRLTQCCTQFKSLGVKVLCVFHLHDNIAFTFKRYGNTWNKSCYSQRI